MAVMGIETFKLSFVQQQDHLNWMVVIESLTEIGVMLYILLKRPMQSTRPCAPYDPITPIEILMILALVTVLPLPQGQRHPAAVEP